MMSGYLIVNISYLLSDFKKLEKSYVEYITDLAIPISEC